MMMKTTLLLMLALALSACAPLATAPAPDGSGEMPPTGSSSRMEESPAPRPSTVLLEQSRTQAAAGEYSAAAASLERAVRIEPGDPRLWLELGHVHYATGDLRQAEAHARKGLSLAGNDRAVTRAAEELLEQINAR